MVVKRSSINGPKIERMLLEDDDEETSRSNYQLIRQNYASPGVAVILIIRMSRLNSNEEIEPLDELDIIQKTRAVFSEKNVFNKQFQLVKYDDHRIFVMSTDPIMAMKGMLRAKELIGTVDINSDDVNLQITGGCEYGDLYELPNDYFGNPVNIASKLAEDTAKPGQLLVSFGSLSPNPINFMPRVTFFPSVVEVSGVSIEHYIMTQKPKSQLFRALSDRKVKNRSSGSSSNRSLRATKSPSVRPSTPKMDLEVEYAGLMAQSSSSLGAEYAKVIMSKGINMRTKERSVGKHLPLQPKKQGPGFESMVLLQSDLSGFTRLTKQYGILHFLKLVLNCRKAFKRSIVNFPGKIIKYDGDNIICRFKTSKDALDCVFEIMKDIQTYNFRKKKDYQIHVKFGIAKGEAIIAKDGDIVGHAWEECCSLSEDIAKVGDILISEEVRKDLLATSSDYNFDLRKNEDDVHRHYNVTKIMK